MTNLTVDRNASEIDRQAVVDGLVAYGDRCVPERAYNPISLVLKSEGQALGGLLGSTVWNWLQIDVLWIDESIRHSGHGSQLLREAEEIARKRACTHARVDTFDFEAVDFYKRSGYTVYAQLDGFPRGHTQFHLCKRLEPPSANAT